MTEHMTTAIESTPGSSRRPARRPRSRAAAVLGELLGHADVELDGSRPWDIRVNDPRFPGRVLAQGALGAGESYMDGWWDCDQLDVMLAKVLTARAEARLPVSAGQAVRVLLSRIVNRQSLRRSRAVARQHYDLGNDFYRDMLDSRMQYTCAYWKSARSLEEAQEHKLDLICRKLALEPGMSILELGCGWGGLARFAAERYGCTVTAYNISVEQVEYAREYNRGLPVQIVLGDYRAARGTYDRVVSIGLCEHVGYKNYDTFFGLIRRSLTDDGLALVHTIGRESSGTTVNPWIDKYIFPGGMLPSIVQIGKATENVLMMEDWHNFGTDYDPTLMAWHANFIRAWPKHRETYGDRFYRMWVFYLLSSAAAFRARRQYLWQIVLSKTGVAGGYTSIR